MTLFENLGILPPVVLAQSLSFLVLLFVVRKYLFGPVDTIMQHRQEQIANSLTGAEQQRMQAESVHRQYQAQLDNIADEAQARLDQAVKDAEAARQRMMEQTQADLRDLRERHEAELARDRERLRRELRAEMSDIAVLAADKALRQQMTPDVHTSVNNQIIAELAKLSAQPRL